MASHLQCVDAFRALPTSSARRAALAALAAELAPDEWRQLKACVDARSFQRDVVGSLPAELALHVFAYLDTSTPFRLQAVSRRWCALLRSTHLLKPQLRSWYDGTDAVEDASYEDCLRRARSIHNFRTGNYIEVAASKPRAEVGGGSERIALTEDFLVDVPYPYRHVQTTNLRTGEGWTATTEGRELITIIAATSELIACWTSTQTVHVFDFSATRRAKLRLPPSLNRFKACRERTIICGGTLDQHIELYIWDLDSQKGKILRLDQPPFDAEITSAQCLDIRVLPNPRSQTFTLFSTRTCEARWCGHHVQDMSIHYYVISFGGQLVQDNVFMIPLPVGATNLAGASITSIHPVDRMGGFRVNVFCRYNHNGYTDSFHFDENTQAFREPELSTSCSEHVKTAWWKDTFYQVDVHHGGWNEKLRVCFKHIGTSGEANQKPHPFIDEASVESMVSGTYIQLLLNDRFAVVEALNRVYVFSFAARAKTADPATDCWTKDEEQGGLVLWSMYPKSIVR